MGELVISLRLFEVGQMAALWLIGEGQSGMNLSKYLRRNILIALSAACSEVVSCWEGGR